MPLSQFVLDTLKEAQTALDACQGTVTSTRKRYTSFEALANDLDDAEIGPAIGRFRDQCVAAMESLQTTLAKF